MSYPPWDVAAQLVQHLMLPCPSRRVERVVVCEDRSKLDAIAWAGQSSTKAAAAVEGEKDDEGESKEAAAQALSKKAALNERIMQMVVVARGMADGAKVGRSHSFASSQSQRRRQSPIESDADQTRAPRHATRSNELPFS